MINFIAKETDETDIFKIHPFSLDIPEAQSICLYEEDDKLR